MSYPALNLQTISDMVWKELFADRVLKFVPVSTSDSLTRIPTTITFTTGYIENSSVADYKDIISDQHFGIENEKI